MIDRHVPDRGSAGYEVRHYDLDLDYSVATNRLGGTARLHLRALEPLPRLSFDLLGLRVSGVAVDGRAARWRQPTGKVVVTPDRAIAAGEAVVVELRYDGTPRPAASAWGLIGWEELADGVLVASQPSGAPTWFPCNDRADHKASFSVTITAASAYRVLSNGVRRDMRVRGSTTTWIYEQQEPTSPYLMSLHVGRYDEVSLARAPVPIRALIARQHRHQLSPAFDRLPQMMQLFVDRFGPYPLEAGYTVVVCPEVLEIPVEAQGQATFGTNHLTPSHERLVAHELAHQWFGNSVTASRWDDIWLHEGFACYAEWLWSEGSGGLTADEHARQHHIRLASLPADLVIGDPPTRDLFDDRVYKRGALTLHVLRRTMGDGPFFDLVHRWTSTYRHGVASTASLAAMAAEVAGRPLDDLFDAWLRSRTLPPLTVA